MTASQPVNNPSIVWTRFLVAFARLLAYPMRDDAAYRGEAFARWQENLLNQMAGEEGTIFIAAALQALLRHDESRLAAELMLEELDAFTTYVERLTGQPIDPDVRYPEPLDAWGRPTKDPEEVKEGLGVGKIIIDSLSDLLDKLPFSWKAGLKALSELAGIAGFHR